MLYSYCEIILFFLNSFFFKLGLNSPLVWILSTLLIATWTIFGVYCIKISRTNSKIRRTDNQLIALRTQLNSHFIFNCLNLIQGLIIQSDTQKATHFTARFSKLLRRILENSDKSHVSVEEEVELLELYLSTEALRFENKFKYSINTVGDIGSIKIPSMVIQPIIENTIWNGLKKANDCMIKISFQQINAMKLCCVVEDNGFNHMLQNDSQLPNLSPKSLNLKLSANRLALLSSRSSVKESTLVDHTGKVVGNKLMIVFDD